MQLTHIHTILYHSNTSLCLRAKHSQIRVDYFCVKLAKIFEYYKMLVKISVHHNFQLLDLNLSHALLCHTCVMHLCMSAGF